MINICPNCSNVDIEKLQLLVGEDNVELGCIGQCGQEFVALVNDELIEATTEEELIAEIKRIC